MAAPEWLGWVLTLAFLGIAGYSVARLVAAGRFPSGYHGCHRAVDVAHTAMAAGMAVMCSPVGGPLPMAGWQTVFVLVTGWFLASWLLAGDRPPPVGWHGSDLHHAVAGLAMLYMLTAVPHSAHAMSSAWTPGPHTGQAALPLLGWAFVAFFAVQAVRLGQVALRRSGSGLLADARVAAGCQLVMAVGSGYLIAAML
ncbi:protein of unknown function [Actinokineospora iranica]|uniref:DUF5134 domain-containing protein n=1 Tax=Actinokineospora iranica TaxID=1271860 RepID=A0A1G6QIB7_9PSEU|nr:protein of unknown function [Actinokineospora iranica]